MNPLKSLLLPLLFIVFFIQSCSQEEYNSLEKPLDFQTEIGDEKTSSLNRNSIGPNTSRCDDRILKLQVEYLIPNATEEDKQKIRNTFNDVVNILSVRKSVTCSEYEIWEVDCYMYETCQSGCDTTTTDADIKIPEFSVIVNCFDGRL